MNVAQTGQLSATPTDQPGPDTARLFEVLNNHGIDYLVVGGVATQLYGAHRPTKDFDCVVRRQSQNLERLAAAMRDLNARLNVEGLSDEEASKLPVQLDRLMLDRMEISTWRTDAGDMDVLVDIPNRAGKHLRYEDLESAAVEVTSAGLSIRVAGLADIIASKEWANRPKDREALPELYELRDKALGPKASIEQVPPRRGRRLR